MRRLELERALQRHATLTSFTEATRRIMQERDHEARSALGAMEYTVQALKRRSADIDEAALIQLETSMSAEISLLRRLITIPDVASAVEPFPVIDAVTGVVESARERGLAVDVDIPEDLMAIGVMEATAEIVQSLLDNARKHAPGSPVTVRAVHAGPYVVLSVDDQGPGIPKTQHRQIFQRGRDGGHPTSVDGRGLGLYISARLATEQRGELWVVDAPGGGASFRLTLEASSIVNAHQTEDGTEMLPRGVAAPPRLSTVRVRHAD
jgi:signal transduction histidine kinase